jgi:hypothetical protein
LIRVNGAIVDQKRISSAEENFPHGARLAFTAMLDLESVVAGSTEAED